MNIGDKIIVNFEGTIEGIHQLKEGIKYEIKSKDFDLPFTTQLFPSIAIKKLHEETSHTTGCQYPEGHECTCRELRHE